MKFYLVSLLLVISLGSCESEYEQRLEQARELKERMQWVESNLASNNAENVSRELKLLQDEIQFLAKVSGNEKLFMQEVFND
jgi:hypothetical protein